MKIRSSTISLPIIMVLSVIAVFGAVIVKDAIVKSFADRNASLVAEAAGDANRNGDSKSADAFKNISLQAKSVYIYDVKENKVIYEQNQDEVLPLASLTKIMTAVVAEEEIPQSAIVVITPQALDEEGDNGLLLGERWSLQSLLNFTLTVSSNDGAHAIAAAGGTIALDQAEQTAQNKLASAAGAVPEETQYGPQEDSASVDEFVSQMNQKAHQLGLTGMTFANPTGLDLDATTSGAYGSAKDVAELFSYAIAQYPNLFDPTTHSELTVTSLSGDTHTVENSNEVVDDIPGIMASKTGNTDLAGGNLVVAMDVGIDYPVIIALLGSTYDGRFSDMQTLASSTLAYFET